MGVTGASGAIYAQRFLRQAAAQWERVMVVMSRQAWQVGQQELGTDPDAGLEGFIGESHSNIELLDTKDYFTPPASGSFRHDGMVIVPCSMGTAGRIANGISDSLMTRSAEVCLKEKRPLIVVPREMPWSLTTLHNMTSLAEAGAHVIPACPAWYGRPSTLEELADTVVARILQSLGAEQSLMKEWMEDKE